MDFMNELKRRLNTAGEKISELEDRITEIQIEAQRGEKRQKKQTDAMIY